MGAKRDKMCNQAAIKGTGNRKCESGRAHFMRSARFLPLYAQYVQNATSTGREARPSHVDVAAEGIEAGAGRAEADQLADVVAPGRDVDVNGLEQRSTTLPWDQIGGADSEIALEREPRLCHALGMRMEL